MIWREHKIFTETVFSKSLCLCDYVDEAAKIFVKYLEEHPEESVKTLNMRIDSEEQEEDHYGNGGGWEHTCVIYRKVEETDTECNLRVLNEEEGIFDKGAEEIVAAVHRTISDVYGYFKNEDKTLVEESINRLFDKVKKKMLK